MLKLVNTERAGWACLGMLFFSVFTVFQVTLLNPQMEITNATYFPMFFKVAVVFGLPLGLLLYLGMALVPARAFPFFFIFCILMVATLPVERALHPLFLHPALIKILYKGAYAGVVLLVGAFLIKRHPWLILLLLGVGSVFLYHRRDAFRPPQGVSYAGSTGGHVPARIAVVSFSGVASDALWDALKAGKIPRLEESGARGCTGTFKVPDSFDEDALFATLLTGTYPYQNRVFGRRSNAYHFLTGTDRMPFYFPPWRSVKEPDPVVPTIWEMLSSRGISCGVVDPPVAQPESDGLTFYFHAGKAFPGDMRPGQEYGSAVSFLFKQMRLQDPWESRLEGELALAREHLKPGDYLVVLAGPAGFVRMEGPGLREGWKATSMKMVDLVPTLAYLMQVPLSAQMPGRILLEAFDDGFLAEHPVGVVGRY